MSLSTEKKLVQNGYYSIKSSTSEYIYRKKYDETTNIECVKQGNRYKVVFPLPDATTSYSKFFDTQQEATQYLNMIIAQIKI